MAKPPSKEKPTRPRTRHGRLSAGCRVLPGSSDESEAIRERIRSAYDYAGALTPTLQREIWDAQVCDGSHERPKDDIRGYTARVGKEDLAWYEVLLIYPRTVVFHRESIANGPFHIAPGEGSEATIRLSTQVKDQYYEPFRDLLWTEFVGAANLEEDDAATLLTYADELFRRMIEINWHKFKSGKKFVPGPTEYKCARELGLEYALKNGKRPPFDKETMRRLAGKVRRKYEKQLTAGGICVIK